jgi:hypothetical protein
MRRFESSRPSQPVGQPKIDCTRIARSLQNTGFFAFGARSPNSELPQPRREFAKVSGEITGYSHFRETLPGDRFRSALNGRGGSEFQSLPAGLQRRRNARCRGNPADLLFKETNGKCCLCLLLQPEQTCQQTPKWTLRGAKCGLLEMKSLASLLTKLRTAPNRSWPRSRE